MAVQIPLISAATVTAPGQDGFAITLSDTQTFTQQGSQPGYCRAIYVGVGGDINLITVGGTTLLFKGALAGSVIPIMCQQVKSTLTTATNLVGII